jgi:hypothetical protein
LGGAAGGQGKGVQYAPALDYALQATQFAGLDPLGFGNINTIPGPYQQLIAQLRSSPMADKTRARVINALTGIRSDPSLLLDPGGQNFSQEQLAGFLRDPSTIPEGRRLAKNNMWDDWKRTGKWGASVLNTLENPIPIKNLGRLEKVLREQGITFDDLKGILEQDDAFKSDMQKLKDNGLDRIRTDTILNRANAAGTAAELLGGAADFARTGQPGNPLSKDLFARDERQLEDLKSRLGLMANFGGLNPATMFENLTDAKLDQNIRLIEQQLGMSNAIQAALNPATAAAAGIANSGSQASMNSAQIAAQQAQAAAALRSQAQMTSSSALANGIAGGLGSLGSAIGNYAYLSQLGNTGTSGRTAGLDFSGPGSTGNQYATQNANNPWMSGF